MSREIDLRDASHLQNVKNTTTEQTAGLVPPKDFFVQRALQHLRNLGDTIGLEPTQPAEFAADHQFQRSSSGSVAVHLNQLYKNIPVFQAASTVIFAPDGSLLHTVGHNVAVAADLDVSPKLSVTDAVLIAAKFVSQPDPEEARTNDQFGSPLRLRSIDLARFQPKVIAVFRDLSEQPTILDSGPFDDVIKASLIWFPLSEGLSLCWEIVLAMPQGQGHFRAMVEASTGRLLYCAELTQFVSARGNVFLTDGSGPRQMTTFPLPLTEYAVPAPSDLPPGFPDNWISANEAGGNSVRAVLDSTDQSLAGSVQNGGLIFNPADASGDDQRILNLFYYTCFMHDFFYLLGFRERDGNFQLDNLNRGGIPQDRLDAHAVPGEVYATANMNTPGDGLVPVMNMGLVAETKRHTALDATVVFHEFTHGVTNRLVGGPMNNHALEAPQSKAMGEGWGDYFACTLKNTIVIAAWVVNKTSGIRGFPYDSHFPDHFGALGTNRYTESHNAGEIWCATLMEMNRRVSPSLGMQLVVDALKLSPATPNFLDMRDAILLALEHKLAAGQLTLAVHDDAFNGIWEAFAKFGMGKNARANGTSFSGNVADFTAPSAGPAPAVSTVLVEATPKLAIPDKDPVGISSTLVIDHAGAVKTLTLSVDIQHPFIGDLQIILVAPDGSAFLLKSPSADNTQNLVTTFSSSGTPVLVGVLGKQAQGIWTLKVADLARLGEGTLRRWSLNVDLDLVGSRPFLKNTHVEVTPNLAIPDKDPVGVTSILMVAATGTVASLILTVDIVHEFVGDLQISLVAPDGSVVVLLSSSMDSSQNLNRSFTPADTSALTMFVGRSSQGNWSLRVADLVRMNIGTLRKWSLDIILN